MQDDYEPVIRSHRLKQLLARRSSNPQANSSSNEPYSEIFESSRTFQQNLCDISTSHKVNSLNNSYRPLPNLPNSSPQATDRNYLTEELPKRKVEPNVFERQSDKENITTRNQTKAISKMLEKENNNTTDMNPVTASSIPTRPNVTSMMTFEDRESTRWETVDNRPVPGETTRRSSLGMIESNLSSYTTSRYPETTNRDFENKSQRSSLAKNLVQPNPSPRHFLRESEPNFMFSADRVSQRASDISGEFLASPAMSEEDLYRSSPFLMYSEVNRSPRLLMASERTGAHMLASQSQPQRVVEGIVCPEHHDSVITYICLQDKCGRLLCKSCVQEHRRKNHQGVYETLQNFKRNVNSQLIQAKASLVTNANQIAHLQFDMDKSGLVEKINKIEESLINGIRQYCDNLRKEYNKDVSLDSGKFSQNLTALHEGINGMVEKLDEDLQSLLACKDNSVLSAQFLSKMVMESYMSCSDEFKSAVAEVNNKVRLFMENQERTVQKSSDMVLQIDNDVVLKLNEFLMKNVKLVKPQQTLSRDSISPRRTSKDVSKPKPDIPKSYETKRPSKEVIVNQKTAEPKQTYKPIAQPKVQQAKRASSVNPKTSRSFSLAQEAEPFEYEEEEQYQQQREQKVQKSVTPKWKGKEDDKDLVSLLWEQQEDIEEQIHTFSARQNEINSNGIDPYPMRLMLKHMAKVYNSEKIKVMDDGFFEGLYDFPEFVSLADFRKRELCFDNVKQYMQIPSGRGRCLFSAYEKVFFLLNLDNKEWALIEVRKSPKSIIIYDFLGKLSRTEIIQNMFDTMFKIIKFEYKTRLGQNVESHMWDRKIAGEPCLSFRDPNDTGILVLKMIANEYKSKPALQGSISPEKIGETRKMLEAIFAALEGNEQENYDAH